MRGSSSLVTRIIVKVEVFYFGNISGDFSIVTWPHVTTFLKGYVTL